MSTWRRELHPGDLFIDVGANAGVYAIWAAECGAEVIAVEPSNDSLPRLRENIALNGYDITVLPVALGPTKGTSPFTVGLDDVNKFAFNVSGPVVVSVETDTLDDVIGARTAAGVKIDVEGAELLVLEGAPVALKEHRIRLLQLEWNDTSVRTLGQDRRPVVELLGASGYQLFRPDADGRLVPAIDPAYGSDVFARPL